MHDVLPLAPSVTVHEAAVQVKLPLPAVVSAQVLPCPHWALQEPLQVPVQVL